MGRKQVESKSIIDSLECNNCTACDLHIVNRQVATGGEVSRSPVLFVKDITSTREANTGIAFTNKNAEVIMNMIVNYRLIGYSIFTNLILCNTSHFDDYDYNKCRHNIVDLIKRTQPFLIVTFGRNAYEKITGDNVHFKKHLYRTITIGKRLIIPLENLYIINRDVEVLSKTILAFNTISKYMDLIHKQYIPVSYDYSEYIRL